ncbi:phosphomannomutase [Rhizobium sp. S152]|uniref:phosphomannomutase n=1 Tax=Rhizobium sp. S152 TaxID=3055038 RepID=UPI0025A93E3E|nr:phosphomannomutase [Rhizobium sp. S152]MDM9625159.1 phosphomannomutase [Rhizobium sp. S152]
MKFGTSGLRGLSEDLKGRAPALFATAFGRYLLLDSGLAQAGDAILIGPDYRDSSPEIATNCTDPHVSLGVDVQDCGTAPTPALALYDLQQKAGCLMVTSSHIPADRNDVKFHRPTGEIKADEAAITAAATALDGAGFAFAPRGTRTQEDSSECLTTLRERNAHTLPAGALAGLKVGVYRHSTIARDLLVDLLMHFGATVVPFGRSETFVPVDTEASCHETIAKLTDAARQHGLDAIVLADGDGDRPIVADETGTPLLGDVLGLIAANFLGATLVVTPVTSNSGIEAADSFSVIRTRVGCPFVISGMQKAIVSGDHNVAGFQANGGVLTASGFDINGHTLRARPTRDCFVPLLATLFLAASRRQPVSVISDSWELPFAVADRFEDFPVETSARLMAHLRSGSSNLATLLDPIGKVGSVSDIDGLRLTLGDRRTIHFRPFSNAPEIRCNVEAEGEAAAAALLGFGLQRINCWVETN